MEVSLPIYRINHQGDLRLPSELAMKALTNSDSNLKCAVLLEKNCYTRKDALFAVKLDPAVLEAQVTVDTSQQTSQGSPINTIIPVPYNNNSNSNVVSRRTHSDPQSNSSFKAMLSMHRSALQSLSSQQFDLLLKYVDTLRKQRLTVQKQMECAFCKNNGHPLVWYSTHSLRDNKGRVRCPILRAFCCRRCGATGDHAHTIKYCPETDISLGEYALC